MRITAANRTDELSRIAAEIGAFVDANDLSPRDAMQVDMAVEEIASNAIKYGFEAGDTRDDAIEVSLALADDRLEIRVRDGGRAFDPLADAPEPNLDAGVEERGIGGLGIHIVKTVMAELRYTREDGHNVLDMVLKLNRPA